MSDKFRDPDWTVSDSRGAQRLGVWRDNILTKKGNRFDVYKIKIQNVYQGHSGPAISWAINEKEIDSTIECLLKAREAIQLEREAADAARDYTRQEKKEEKLPPKNSLADDDIPFN